MYKLAPVVILAFWLVFIPFLTEASEASRFILEAGYNVNIPPLHVPLLHMNKEEEFLLDMGPGLAYTVNRQDIKKISLPPGRFIAASLSSGSLQLLEPGFKIIQFSPASGAAKTILERTQDAANMPYGIVFGHDEWLYVINRDTGKTWVFTPDMVLRYQYRLPVSGRSVKTLPAQSGIALFDPAIGMIRIYSQDGVLKNELSGTDGLSACTVTPDGEIIAAGRGYVCRWNRTGIMMKGYPQKLALTNPSSVAADGSTTLILDKNGPVLIRLKPGLSPTYSDLSSMLSSGDALSCPGRGLAIVADRNDLTAIAVDSQSSLIRRYTIDAYDNDGFILIRDGMGNNFIARNGGLSPMLLRNRLAESKVLAELINNSGRLSSIAARPDETLCFLSTDMKLFIESLLNSRQHSVAFDIASRGGSASQPVAIQQISGGRIAVLDRYNRQLIVYESDVRVAWQAGVGQDADGDGRMDIGVPPAFTDPVALATNIDGYIFVLDRGASMILVFDTMGRMSRAFRIPDSASTFSVSHLGYVWMTDDTGKVLYLFNDIGEPLARFSSKRFKGVIVSLASWGTEISLLIREPKGLKLYRVKAVDRASRARYLFDRGRYADAVNDVEVLKSTGEIDHAILAVRILISVGRRGESVELFESLVGQAVSQEYAGIMESLREQVYNP